MKAFTRLEIPQGRVEEYATRMREAGYAVSQAHDHVCVWLEMDPAGWGVIPALQVLEMHLGMAASGMFFPARVMHTEAE